MHSRRSPFLGGAFLLALGVAAACADSEPPDVPGYGPPNGLATKTPGPPPSGGGDAGTTVVVTSDGGEGGTVVATPQYACVKAGGAIVDAGPCAVSWTRDIYPNTQATGAWGCAGASPCHGTTLPVMTGSASAVYSTLANYTSPTILMNSNPYFNPCSTNPANSDFVCNTLPTGTAGLCGNSMPLVTPIADAGAIAAWVACGAPMN